MTRHVRRFLENDCGSSPSNREKRIRRLEQPAPCLSVAKRALGVRSSKEQLLVLEKPPLSQEGGGRIRKDRKGTRTSFRYLCPLTEVEIAISQ